MNRQKMLQQMEVLRTKRRKLRAARTEKIKQLRTGTVKVTPKPPKKQVVIPSRPQTQQKIKQSKVPAVTAKDVAPKQPVKARKGCGKCRRTIRYR